MKLSACLKDFMKKLDLFPATQFLRYNSEAEYKTATGGFISIAVLITFCILFFNLGLETINQQIITGSVSYSIQVEPTPISINLTKGSPFMFSVGINGLNLSDPSMVYFNITLKQTFYNTVLTEINSTIIPLVQCTLQHFSFNSDIRALFNKLPVTNALCPPFNYQLHIGGRAVSSEYSRIQILIQDCNKTINSNCVDDSIIAALEQQYGGFMLIMPIINTIINTQDQIYKQVYLQDRNYYYFNTKMGVELLGQIEQYQIDTDTSLMPFSNIYTEYATVVPNLLVAKPRTFTSSRYAQINFVKSSTSTTYTRSFNKIDSFLSYVGGLVGTTLIIFFVLGAYSEKAYVMSIAQEIYKLQEDSQSKAQPFNFGKFIMMNINQVINMFNKQCEWSDKCSRIVDQMQKQLNISFLLKRMNYYEDAISSILSEHQALCLYLNQKKSITLAAQSRKASIITKKARQKDKKNEIKQDFSAANNQKSFNNLEDMSKPIPAVGSQKINEQSIQQCSDGSSSCDQSKKDRIKQSLVQVIRQSHEGNPISRRIVDKLSKINIFEQMGLSSNNVKIDTNDEKLRVSNNELNNEIVKVGSNFQFLQFQENQ